MPQPDREFGFNAQVFVSGGVASPSDELGPAALAGATVHRQSLSWAALQPRPGDPPLRGDGAAGAYRNRIDRFYDTAVASGITPIFTTSSAPRWATKYASCWLFDFGCEEIARSNHKLPPDAAHLGDYERFIRAVKQRWPRTLIEPWNEPNLFWGHPSYQGSMAFAAEPEHFKDMQCVAYRASKAVNADPVLAAGWAFYRYAEYVNRVYAAGGQRCWDIANFHAYTGREVKFGAGTSLAQLFQQIRSLRTRYGDSDPIWITETGFSTSGPDALSEASQRDASARLYNRLVTMPDVEAVIFHTLRDAGSQPGDREYGFGFLRADGSSKPVYCQFVVQAGNPASRCP